MCGVLIIYYKVVKKPSLIAPFRKISLREGSYLFYNFAFNEVSKKIILHVF